MSGEAILAIDIGGTKMLATLIDGATVLAERELARRSAGGPWHPTTAPRR